MPYSIRKIGKNKYQVYNTATGEVHSKGTSKKKAEGQFRLLQGIARNEVIGLEGGGWLEKRTIEELRTLPPSYSTLDRMWMYHRALSIIQSLRPPTSVSALMRTLKNDLEEHNRNIEQDMLNALAEDDPTGRGLKGGKKWNFSNRSYNPATLAYNALLNGMTENYRSDITKEGVRQDVDRNIEQAKKFAKNPNPVAFAKNEAEGQFSRYGSGYPANPSDYQPRRFL
jgi:hypothetical protein